MRLWHHWYAEGHTCWGYSSWVSRWRQLLIYIQNFCDSLRMRWMRLQIRIRRRPRLGKNIFLLITKKCTVDMQDRKQRILIIYLRWVSFSYMTEATSTKLLFLQPKFAKYQVRKIKISIFAWLWVKWWLSYIMIAVTLVSRHLYGYISSITKFWQLYGNFATPSWHFLLLARWLRE